MAIARLHGGPLDGQTLPLDDADLDRLILPYSETQVVYTRSGEAENTGSDDGATEVAFRFEEAEDRLVQDGEGEGDVKHRS
ncbi:response regulator [Microbacterium oryzae]|uniref:response regulator n=1 Tax=Microbacterium oryzae TaxID=743009 RepID=UPI0025AFB3EB|nr:response regulator [Microbacterium oryzae]MDN3311924.1 response regulator [Microbacterium oryzae]